MKDNELTIDEITSLREEWDRIVNEGLALRDNIASATGYDQTAKDEQQQSASVSYNTSMSQDTGDALLGRATAMYEIALNIYDAIVSVQNITVIASQNNSLLDEIRNLAISSNGYLEDISRYQKKIWEKVNIRLDDINYILKGKL